jgi:broad specificity phosphatase PhoE/predicted kinase
MTWRPIDLKPLAIVMVGKPARGKTFTAGRIVRYTRWLGYASRLFNVGEYRRERLGTGQHHSFFDFTNEEGRVALEALARDATEDLVTWMSSGGEVAVLDATNGTRERRGWIRSRLEQAGIRVVFIEVVCEDPAWIERNVRNTKLYSPDYEGRDPDEAVRDFTARIGHYARTYRSVAEDEGSFIRLTDMGRKTELNWIEGFLPGRLVAFLTHLHDSARTIYLTRHGQSRDNELGRIGGDSALTEAGRAYAGRLQDYLSGEVAADAPLNVWHSSLQRTIETASPLGRACNEWKLLDEIDAGICEGMSYGEIEQGMPEEFEARRKDKFGYRYPQGESYQDVIARLDPVVLEMERRRNPIVIIAHQAVLRALYCYLIGSPREQCPFLEIPLHTIIRLTPGPYQNYEMRVPLEI